MDLFLQQFCNASSPTAKGDEREANILIYPKVDDIFVSFGLCDEDSKNTTLSRHFVKKCNSIFKGHIQPMPVREGRGL